MLAEKQIACTACGSDFMFSAEEQEFYQSKGFQDPRKCKPCRDHAKQNRGRGGGGYGHAPRQLFDTVCSSCGIQTQVPFQPNGSKPVYCRDCYRNSAAYY